MEDAQQNQRLTHPYRCSSSAPKTWNNLAKAKLERNISSCSPSTLYKENTIVCTTELSGSGRVFSGFGIWPKYGAGTRKTINILTGSEIWLFPGKRDSPKIGHGIRDLCLRVCRECRKPLKTRVNSKYQSKGSTYILHLLAFVEIRLFNVFLWEKKAVFGKLMKNVGDAGFSRKRGGNAGSGPPLPDPKLSR